MVRDMSKKDKIINLFENGFNGNQIAKFTGIGKSYVYRVIDDLDFNDPELLFWTRSDNYGKNIDYRAYYETCMNVTLSENDVLHHIDLDCFNNDLNNLYLTNSVIHGNLHNSLKKLMSVLIKRGVVVFDKQTRMYYYVGDLNE